MFAILLKVLNANVYLYHDLNFQGAQAMCELFEFENAQQLI